MRTTLDLPAPLLEYEAGVRQYEDARRGLGERFIQNVEAAIAGICESPRRWPILEQDIRRRLTRVFPFAVLYTVEADHILIPAIMHCHRRPGYWRSRLGAAVES